MIEHLQDPAFCPCKRCVETREKIRAAPDGAVISVPNIEHYLKYPLKYPLPGGSVSERAKIERQIEELKNPDAARTLGEQARDDACKRFAASEREKPTYLIAAMFKDWHAPTLVTLEHQLRSLRAEVSSALEPNAMISWQDVREWRDNLDEMQETLETINERDHVSAGVAAGPDRPSRLVRVLRACRARTRHPDLRRAPA